LRLAHAAACGDWLLRPPSFTRANRWRQTQVTAIIDQHNHTKSLVWAPRENIKGRSSPHPCRICRTESAAWDERSRGRPVGGGRHGSAGAGRRCRRHCGRGTAAADKTWPSIPRAEQTHSNLPPPPMEARSLLSRPLSCVDHSIHSPQPLTLAVSPSSSPASSAL